MDNCGLWKDACESAGYIGLTQAEPNSGDGSADDRWEELFALFESCGVSSEHVRMYSLPYINAVLPKVAERSAMRSLSYPILGSAPKGTTKIAKAETRKGLPTARGIDEFFTGLL